MMLGLDEFAHIILPSTQTAATQPQNLLKSVLHRRHTFDTNKRSVFFFTCQLIIFPLAAISSEKCFNCSVFHCENRAFDATKVIPKLWMRAHYSYFNCITGKFHFYMQQNEVITTHKSHYYRKEI